MTLAITLDLRDYAFETHATLKALVRELVPAVREDFPKVAIRGMVISERQMKWLPLDSYMAGEPLEQVKSKVLRSVDGWPVEIVPEGYCPHCGNIHENYQAWYG